MNSYPFRYPDGLDNRPSSEVRDETAFDLGWRYQFVMHLFNELFQKLHRFKDDLERFDQYCHNLFVLPNGMVRADVARDIQSIENSIAAKIQDFKDLYVNCNSSDALYRSHILSNYESLYRDYVCRIAACSSRIEWQAAPIHSSTEQGFILAEDVDSCDVVYKRFGHPHLKRFETQYLREFVPHAKKEGLCCLATSSGMGAFTVIESFLLRHHLKPGDKLLYSSNIYFENALQLESLRRYGIEVVATSARTTNALVAAICQEQPRVCFLEPLSNEEDPCIIDVRNIITHLFHSQQRETFIVIDTTMTSGGDRLYDADLAYANGRHIHIISLESLAKYKQYGTDRATAGMIVADSEFYAGLCDQRARTGTVLADFQVQCLPLPDRRVHDERMMIIHRNAVCFATAIDSFLSQIDLPWCRAGYVGVPSHPQYCETQGFAYLGGVVPIVTKPNRRPTKFQLKATLDSLINRARKADVSLHVGTSFGFATTRVSIISRGSGEESYLRFSIGHETLHDTRRLCDVIVDTFNAMQKGM